MTPAPARRPGRVPHRTKQKRRARLLRILLVLVAFGTLGVAGLAAYMGFIPGLDSVRAARELDRQSDSATAAVAADTALPAAVAESLAVAGVPVPGQEVVTLADSASGDMVFRDPGRCVACHGTVGEGVPGLGPNLRDTLGWTGTGSLASIRRVVGGGTPASPRYRIAMPAYGGQLTSEDLDRVSAFVYALSHPGRTIADSTPAATTPAAGDSAGGAANATAAAGARRP
jgi:mono/diheme cytochrome c family protein